MDPAIPASAVELALDLAGAFLIWRLVLRRRAREGAPPAALGPWPAPPSDLFLFLALVIGGALAAQFAALPFLRRSHLDSDSRLIIAGAAMELGALAGAAAFQRGSSGRWWPPPRGLGGAAAGGAVVFLVALPVVTLATVAWEGLLNLCGVPIVRQEMLDLLMNTRSPLARDLLIAVAVVGAPMAEEIVFRAGLFRYLRTHLPRWAARRAAATGTPLLARLLRPPVPRWAALLAPAILFGAAHGSLALFPPLVVLGVVFSLAYERTGRIGTTIVAHSLFNLNSVLLVLAGVSA